MNEILGLGGRGYLSQASRGTGLSPSQGLGGLAADPTSNGLAGQLGAITNAQGQTLFDIREELKSAVLAALADLDGATDQQSAVQNAVHATLTEHGFDPAAFEAARTGLQPMAGLGGASSPAALARQGVESLDLDAMFGGEKDDEEGADDFLQALLGQYRAGINLDLEV